MKNLVLRPISQAGLFLAVALLLVAVTALPRASADHHTTASGSAQVIVVHAIPGSALAAPESLPVDVLVNDSICLLKGFRYKEVVGPVDLDPGSYNIKVSLANETAPCSNDAVIEQNASLSAGQSVVLAAYINDHGNPVVEPFAIDLSKTGNARATVIHLADAPAVDVTLTNPYTGTSANFWYVERGDARTAEVEPRFYLLSLYDSLTNEMLGSYSEVDLLDGTTYITFAFGSLNGGTFDLVTKAYDTPGATKTADDYRKKDLHDYGYDTRIHSRWWE